MALPKIREQIEARVKDTGDTMTDVLYINKASYPGVAFNNTTTGQRVTFSAWENSAVMQTCNVAGDTNNCRNLFLKNSNAVSNITNSLTLRDYVEGTLTEYKIYGEHNKALIKEFCLPIEGGTIASVSGDTPLYIKSASTSTWIGYKDSSNTTLGFLGMKSDGPAYYKDKAYKILHDGNYNSYSPTLTGGGASGTWGISISGSAATLSATLSVDKGGTGQTTAKNAANAFMNALETGSSTPVDADYYISQYVGGGTTTTTYHRRPMSALWSYINGKVSASYPTKTGSGASGTWGISISGNAATATKATQDGNGATIASTYLKLSGGTMIGVINKAGSSSSWINGRDRALVRLNSFNAYSAITSMKTTNGSWEMGVYTNDNMWFTYTPDTNYSSNTNNGYTQIQISSTGALVVPVNTDYTTYKARNIAANTSALTSGSSSLSDGYIYLQYE